MLKSAGVGKLPVVVRGPAEVVLAARSMANDGRVSPIFLLSRHAGGAGIGVGAPPLRAGLPRRAQGRGDSRRPLAARLACARACARVRVRVPARLRLVCALVFLLVWSRECNVCVRAGAACGRGSRGAPVRPMRTAGHQ